MQAKSLSISQFKAHCTEELRLVAERGITLHITRHGKIVATVSPPTSTGKPRSLREWAGSGAGTVVFPPDYDPHAPATEPEDWEVLKENGPLYGKSAPVKSKSKRKPRK